MRPLILHQEVYKVKSIDISEMKGEISIYKMFLILLHWVLNLNLYCSCIFSLGLTWLGGAVIAPPDHQMCVASIWLQPRSKINSILDFRQIFSIFDVIKYVCPHFTLHIHFSFIVVWETDTSVPAYSLQLGIMSLKQRTGSKRNK